MELDQFACYVIADGIDDQLEAVSARLAVSAAVSAFSEDPSMQKKTLRRCLKAANQALITAKSKLKVKSIAYYSDYRLCSHTIWTGGEYQIAAVSRRFCEGTIVRPVTCGRSCKGR